MTHLCVSYTLLRLCFVVSLCICVSTGSGARLEKLRLAKVLDRDPGSGMLVWGTRMMSLPPEGLPPFLGMWSGATVSPELRGWGNYRLGPRAFQRLGWGSPKFRERNCEMESLKVSEALESVNCVWIDRGEVCLGLKGSSGPLGTT